MGYISDLRRSVGTRPLILAGSCVLVFNPEGSLLLQHRTDSFDWGMIGGALEPGESLEQTAARELQEEAGLTAGSFKFVTVLSGEDMYYRYPHGDEVFNVTAVFEAQDVQGIPRVNDDEGLELKYFSLDKPIEGLNPFTEHMLRRAGYITKW